MGRARRKAVAASAHYADLIVSRMNGCFHDFTSIRSHLILKDTPRIQQPEARKIKDLRESAAKKLWRRPQKTAVPKPRRTRFRFCPLLASIYRLSQFSPGGKLRHLPSSNFDGGARLWIPSIAGLSLRYREGAKSNQRYPITFLQCTCNAFHSGVDCGSGLRFTDSGSGCDAVNEIGFIHRLSWRVSLSPKAPGKDAPMSLETRRHYLAPHREESQLWKSWKSAPDGVLYASGSIAAIAGSSLERKENSHSPRRLAAENGSWHSHL